MTNSSPEQLEQLSKIIQDEEMRILIDHMARVFQAEDEAARANVNPRKQTEYEKHASLLLRSMRVHLCLDLIGQGYKSCLEELRSDWNEIIDCLKFLEYVWEVPDELYSDAVDLILLLDPGKREALLRLLDPGIRRKIRAIRPLRCHVAEAAFGMADYCLKTGRGEELFRIIPNLIALSEDRNARDLKRHRMVTARSLYYIVDNDRELTERICQQQERYYQGIVDADACNFYWFYSFTVTNLNRGQEAYPLLKRCHDLCMAVEGERSWIGVRTGSIYYYPLLFTEQAKDAEAYLWDSLEKIDSGFYTNMDQTAGEIAAITRSQLLRARLERQDLHGLLPEIERLLAYCESVAHINTNPYLTIRHTENIPAAYYLDAGDYLQAADHTLKALQDVPPEGMTPFPSDILLYSNLLLIYSSLNDVEQSRYYIDKLYDLAESHAEDPYVMSRILLIVNSTVRKLDPESYDLEDDRKLILDFYRTLSTEGIAPYDSDAQNLAFAQYMLDMCSAVLDTFTADAGELNRIRTIIRYFMDRPRIYQFNDIQNCTNYSMLTQIAWQSGSGNVLAYLEECLRLVKAISESREGRIAILRFAAVVYHNFHRPDLAAATVEEVLSSITKAWHKATAYLNDHRVSQVFALIQFHFGVCYSILRTQFSAEALYERLLRFKALPALVGRERNRLLRLAPVDEALKERIFAKQNQLAAAEMNDSLNGTDHAQQIAAELERLESRFAAQFPQNLHFTEISFHRVCRKMPDNSAIAEYYFVINETGLDGKPYPLEALDLDLFITTKKRGVARLHHIKIPRGDIIREQAEQYLHILQNPDDILSSGDRESLRAELYRKLVVPVLPYLNGITTLYLAPDEELCHLPFEILHVGKSGTLQDRYQVCRLVCGRDILFFDDSDSASGGDFVLGDPNYESDRGERSAAQTRGAQMHLEPVQPLPFSGIEAERIGRRCHARVYTGDAATKYALQDALPSRVIHLATHGIFDETLEADSLYASHLVFAGYNKWVSSKTENRHCGNGILTADEISRMDLKKTELVVLSACRSGMGDTSYGSVQGLLSAFAAAGARWIISHLWEADDFSTPILMDAFYNAWLNRGYNIPDALQYAKNYLRTVSIGTLRREGWLRLPDDPRFCADTRDAIADMNAWPEDTRPFEDELFWGGFTVHQSR